MKAKQVSSGPPIIWVAVLEDGDEHFTEMNFWIAKRAVAGGADGATGPPSAAISGEPAATC
jgi:hypothetical protein